MIDPFLLEVLCCPETKGDLVEATPEEVVALNRAIAGGGVKNRAGQDVGEPVEAALIRADRQVAYVVRDSIPVMLIDEAIPLPGLL